MFPWNLQDPKTGASAFPLRGHSPAKSACVQTFSQQTAFNLQHSLRLSPSVVHHYDKAGQEERLRVAEVFWTALCDGRE